MLGYFVVSIDVMKIYNGLLSEVKDEDIGADCLIEIDEEPFYVCSSLTTVTIEENMHRFSRRQR